MSDEVRASRPSRRWFLAGGVAAVVGAGAGVGVGFLQPESAPKPNPAPAELTDALAAERELLTLAAVALGRDPSLRADVAALRSDHTAHLRALQSAIASYDTSPTPSSTTASSTTPTPSSAPTSPVRAQLRAAERAAATAAAARAERLTGSTAVLLASISACESTHAELLT